MRGSRRIRIRRMKTMRRRNTRQRRRNTRKRRRTKVENPEEQRALKERED